MLRRIRDLLGRRGKPSDDPSTALPAAAEALTQPEDRAGDGAIAAELADAGTPVHHAPRVVHMPIPEADLDPDAVRIVRRLVRFDHTAYLVGGCVRDLLLERTPKDFDIATAATPRQVRRLFSNCRIIGRRFRLAHIYFQNGKIIEVATFRARDLEEPVEQQEGDDLLIREDNVFGTPEDDAMRRDFTINALFYDLTNGTVIDHAGGLHDLRRRLVRTIGEPGIRFREDPIRILRAIKFAARLGFDIEQGTHRALVGLRGEIPKAAPPRVLEELIRFCRGGAARASFALLDETGVLEVVLPEIAASFDRVQGARGMAWGLLDGLDRRTSDGQEPAAGTILALLLLPAMVPRLGWDGTPAKPLRGPAAREMADDLLRPVALRLRVSRRDQEHVRQMFVALQRMVPMGSPRRGFVASLVRRPAFDDALFVVQTLAASMGGELVAAAEFWQEAAQRRGTAPPPEAAEERGAEAVAEPAGEERPSRRRRRRRRARSGRQETAAERAEAPEGESRAPAAVEAPARPRPERRGGGRRRRGGVGGGGQRPAVRPGLPPPWDDDYFFAALPTVPSLEETPEEVEPVEPRDEQATAPSPDSDLDAAEEAPVAGPEPRRRRRRRGGRRRRGRGGVAVHAASATPDGDPSEG